MSDSSPSDFVLSELPHRSPQGCSRRHFGRMSLGMGVSAGWTLLGGGLLSGCTSVDRPAADGPQKQGYPRLLPFSDQPATGDLPLGWEPYLIRRNLKRTQYRTVEMDGRTVLHARADSAASALQAHVRVDPLATPWFSWSWRVDKVHLQATVTDDDVEDTPARIVLAFEGEISKLPLRDRIFFEQVELFTGNHLPYATLAYAWDGQASVGQVVPYVRSKRLQNHIVESGAVHEGVWRHYQRNVAEDFQRIFGEAPPGIIRSVGVLTDSDDLRNTAEAWYGDMSFSAQASAG